jgi:hypothetical protein
MKSALLVALVSCYHPVSYGTCAVTCGSNGECPSGLICVGGLCSTGKTCGPTVDAAIPDTPPDAAIDADIMLCPSTYNYVASHASAYRFVTNRVSWQTAASDCAGDQPGTNQVGTHLVAIESATELSFLNTTYGPSDIWVGLTDLAMSPNYQWVTIEPIGIASGLWGSGEPNNVNTEQCVDLEPPTATDPGKLDTTPCGDMHQYICECDAYLNDPSRY